MIELAKIKIGSGRFYLDVCGVVVAVSGTLCYDPEFPGRFWSEGILRAAADRINERFEELIDQANEGSKD